jgi:hypothetical protein
VGRRIHHFQSWAAKARTASRKFRTHRSQNPARHQVIPGRSGLRRRYR